MTSLYYEKILLAKDHRADEGNGANAELRWKNQMNNIVFGTDLETKTLESNKIANGEQTLRKAGFYLNDTLSFSRVSVTPGIRYDHTSSNKDFTSPSLGVTFSVAETTILRAYAARGYSIPTLGMRYGDNMFVTANPDLKMERVLSYQSGVETAALKYIWTKLSVFRHEIQDVIAPDPLSGPSMKIINKGRQRRQGMEAQFKTAPFYGASLTGGVEYISARDLDSNLIIKNIPRHIYDLGLLYESGNAFAAQLKGRYINWNADPAYGASDDSFVSDLNIMKVLFANSDTSLEMFATVHNLFNDSLYPLSGYKNSDRWAEAGMRYKF
jgi:vitamin B12 transporter